MLRQEINTTLMTNIFFPRLSKKRKLANKGETQDGFVREKRITRERWWLSTKSNQIRREIEEEGNAFQFSNG